MEPLRAGEAVRAFYYMNDHPNGFRYVRLLDFTEEVSSEDPPAIGLSTGWMPATVAEDWSPLPNNSDADPPRVLVRFHGRFKDAYNQEKKPVDNLYWKVRRDHVRIMGMAQSPAQLSMLVVRWWDYWNPKNRRSRTHNVANEEMLLDVLAGPGSAHALLAEEAAYEVHSAFIRSTADLELIGPSMINAMRGRHRVGLYFLWPTQRAVVERRLPGAVAEPALFALMHRMEAAGIRSCWPHTASLYRQLAGKLWVPQISMQRPDLRTPKTVQLDVALWTEDPNAATEMALLELQRQPTRASDCQNPSSDSFRGVAKLGFSWMGEDVIPFTGASELLRVLQQLLDGSPQDAVCLIQERIENVVCEVRFVCIQDRAKGVDVVTRELVRMRQHPPRHSSDNTFALASHLTMTPQEAVREVFFGSWEALRVAEKEAERLAELWLRWFHDEGHGTPTACRLDFLVAAKRPDVVGGPVPVELWTVELCECGGSLCGLHWGARAVACLNECLSEAVDRPPQPLPPFHVEPDTHTGAVVNGPSASGITGLLRMLRSWGTRQSAHLLSRKASGLTLLSAVVAVFLPLWLRRRRRRNA